MKTLLFVVATTTMLSVPAFAQSIGEKTGVNATLGIAPRTQDFITEAAGSDMLEIAAAKVAQQKGSPDEKRFATQMVTDHTKTSAELKQMITDGTVKAELPTALNATAENRLKKLQDAKPDEFAATYDPMQVGVHEDAVSLFERFAKGGDNDKLKDWAGKTLPALRHHLEMAQQIENTRRGATVGSAPSRVTPAPYGAK